MSACVRFPSIDLTKVAIYSSSVVDWTQTLPTGATIVVESSINGEEFATVTKGGDITQLSASDSVVGVDLTLRVRLATTGSGGPIMSAMTLTMVGTGPSLTQPTDRYNFGHLKWLTGANKDKAIEVKRWDADTFQLVLFLPMTNDIAVADTFEIFPGCDKSLTDCSVFFDNIINFRGEPHVPGQDVLNQFPDFRL